MKNITKSRLNAIQNAGTMLDALDFQSDLSDSELADMHLIGSLLIEYDREVLKLLINLSSGNTVKLVKDCSAPCEWCGKILHPKYYCNICDNDE